MRGFGGLEGGHARVSSETGQPSSELAAFIGSEEAEKVDTHTDVGDEAPVGEGDEDTSDLDRSLIQRFESDRLRFRS